MQSFIRFLYFTCPFFIALACGRPSGDNGGTSPNDGITLTLPATAWLAGELNATGSDVKWDIKLQSRGTTALELKAEKWQMIETALSNLRFSKGDTGEIELTASGQDTVFATNVSSIAALTPDHKAKWDNECGRFANTHFEIRETDIRETGGKKTVNVLLKLCDFSGLLLVPSVSVVPAAATRTIYNIAFKCPVKLTTGSMGVEILPQWTATACDYGYDGESGETVPELRAPKRLAMGSADYLASQLQLKTLKVEKTRNGHGYALETTFGAAPFGSHASCYKQVLEFTFEDSGHIKTARARYKKLTSPDGSISWWLENEESLPNFAAVSQYYRSAAQNSATMTLYRFCEWSPEAMGETTTTVLNP